MMAARFAVVLLAAFFAHSFAAPSYAGDVARVQSATDLSAQERPVGYVRYARPRVRVYRYPQPPFWEYPRPGTYSWPGPGVKRDCRAWYVIENRPSGAVMTPRMRCEWVPG